MNWFVLALIPPIFWTISNIVDSYVSRSKTRNIWESLIIVNLSKIPFIIAFGGFIAWRDISLGLDAALWGMLLGGFYTIGVLIYLMVLQREDASLSLPLYQIGPLWSMILGFLILSEIPSSHSLLGIGVILFGGYILSKEGGKSFIVQRKMITIFGMVLISSLLFNITYVLFKHAHSTISLYELFFFQYIFQSLFSVILGIIGNKIEFKKNFVRGNRNIWAFSITGESIGIFGTLLSMFAFMAGPVAIVSALGATQMIWLLLMSFLLSKFYPQYFSEKWDRETGYKKIIGVCIIFIGILILGYDNYR